MFSSSPVASVFVLCRFVVTGVVELVIDSFSLERLTLSFSSCFSGDQS